MRETVGGPLSTLVTAEPDRPMTRKISGTGRAIRLLSMTPIAPMGGSDRGATVSGSIVVLNSNEFEFDNVETIGIDLSEAAATGHATHRGHTITTHAGGEKTFVVYEGAVRTMPRPGGRPYTTFEGDWWYTGGTGKFSRIVGGGTYAGRVTTAGLSYTFDGEYHLGEVWHGSRVAHCA